ncbi:MAG: J domain-containing protein [Acidimicrobiia bacterium]|nr:J domain-containing protein [Acidimicrobiia bacterium]
MAEHEGVLPATEEIERARELFGLGPAPTRRQVIQAWRDAARLAHPDLAGPDSAKTAERLMQRINEARAVLLAALPPEPPEPAPDVFAEAGLYEPLWTDDPDEFDDSATPPVPYPRNGRRLARWRGVQPPDMTPLQPRGSANGSNPFDHPGVNIPYEPQAVVEPVPPVRPVPPSAPAFPRPTAVAPVPPIPPCPPLTPYRPQSRPLTQPVPSGMYGMYDRNGYAAAQAYPPGLRPPGPVPPQTALRPEVPVVGPTGAPTVLDTRPYLPPPPEPVEEPRPRRLSTRSATLVCVGIAVAIVAAVLLWISTRADPTATESGLGLPPPSVCVVDAAPHSQARHCDEYTGDPWTRR